MVQIRVQGPVFDGRANGYMDTMLAEIKAEVADYSLFQWRMNLDESIQVSTGRYTGSTEVVRRELDFVVDDGYPGSAILYGPWLEGVGSRNESTRFKGYFAMRRAANQVRLKVRDLAAPIVDKWTGRADA